MKGERMDTVKTTAIELVRQLRPFDILSVVTFSDRAEVLLPAGRLPERSEAESRIQMIQTGGGTEIYRGLEAGFFEVRRNLSKSHISQLFLLTDGRTYGDEPACIKIAEQAGAAGVGISCLGIGDGWNDAFLDNLAARAGGNSVYVSTPRYQVFLKQNSAA
jgi:Ca-activated chloride channel family protein